MAEGRGEGAAAPAPNRVLVLLEVLLVFAVVMAAIVALRHTAVFRWEKEHLGWTYSGMAVYIGIPAIAAWLTRRRWAEFGVSTAEWRANLDAGVKATLVRCLPTLLGWWGARLLGLGSSPVAGGAFEAALWIAALALLLWVLRRPKAVPSGRPNLALIGALLLIPIGAALAMGGLSVIIVSTIVWQFLLSGFGEEFVYRGYYQSRLNQAFGRPLRLFGAPFGLGLIVASLLFGLNHALNSFDPAVGLSSLSWGPALGSFAAGLFFGVLREKTGTLLAPGLAHGLLDAVGEPVMKLFGWG